MAAHKKSGEKSRREQRKEARMAKNKKKFESWIQHQKSSWNSKPKNMTLSQNNPHIPKGRGLMSMDTGDESDCGLEVNAMTRHSDSKLGSPRFSDSNSPKVAKRKKDLVGNSKTKFEEFLETDLHQGRISAEDDARMEMKLAKKLMVKDGKLRKEYDDMDMLLGEIPSVFDSLEANRTPHFELAEEASNMSVKNLSLCVKQKNRNSVKEERVEPMKEDSLIELSDPVDITCVNHDAKKEQKKSRLSKVKFISSKDPRSIQMKVLKKKKTKFEEYLEREMQASISAEEDLVLERKLAKKLKVKGGKLWDIADGLNELVEDIPSALSPLEDEVIPNAEEAPAKNHQNKHRKQKNVVSSVQEKDIISMAEDVVVGVPDPIKPSATDVDLEECTPRARYCVDNELENHSQTRRRVRGLLNRLSESNVEPITGEMVEIFNSVGRSVGSQIIRDEVLASCSNGPRGNDQYAAVFAAFVSGMACSIGIDFGAKLLASLSRHFEDEYLKEDNLSLRNLTLLLSYLYIFGVCSSDLIYDFLIMLSKRLEEIDVSTILTILQCCGMKLRGDDPIAMKNFVISVQNQVNELKAASASGNTTMYSKRMEFMLETICDIKNNKKRPKEDTIQLVRIKKWLQKARADNILIRGLKWSTLLDPNKKGQWWISGDMASGLSNVDEVANKIDRETLEAQKMLQLAAAQRMNTDLRRAIFCIVMSGEDYIDAFEKLLRLDMPGKQDREIMRVIVDCCLQEKVFNMYYCVLASKLCSHDKNHKFTLQYCIWDHFKELDSMEMIRSMHLSKFVVEMVASFTLSLAVLKVVDLEDTSQLTPKRIMHLRMLFEGLFEKSDTLIWNIFSRVAGTPDYESLRNGLEFFITTYVVSNQSSLVKKFKTAKKALKNVEGVIM